MPNWVLRPHPGARAAGVLAHPGSDSTDILTATEVPAANEIQCGWGANHTLEGAQNAAREFLAARADWEQVMAA